MVMNEETLPLATVKARLSEVVDRVESRHERVTLTRNGRPAAVLIAPEDLEALEDTLDILSNPEAVREIEKARKEIARGKGLSADELRAKYLSD
jgi:antitoxin YefM